MLVDFPATFRRSSRAIVAGGVCIAVTAGSLRAQVNPDFDVTSLSIEELGMVNISTAAKRSQPLFETPGAVSVILSQDVERNGFGSVPDALRLVPGAHVAQNNNSRWSVGIRGFNGLTSTKLLVLVDGRTVYSPYYAGVDWNNADVHLADLSRIEVIRGPGATLWGANAVNGIVNVLSKSAQETQGGIFSVRGGTAEDLDVYARYGGAAGDHVWYRVFARAESSSRSLSEQDAAGWIGNDRWQTGSRTDIELSGSDQLTWQGEIGNYQATFAGIVCRPGGGAVNVAEDGHSLDLDITHRRRLNEAHDPVWGGGIRHTLTDVELDGSLQVAEPRSIDVLHNLFAQDEIALLADKLQLTRGSKLEHHDSVGWQELPRVRRAYLPSLRQTWWGAVSRAIRSPSRSERDRRLTCANIPATPFAPPMRVDLVGTSAIEEEELVAWEAGWRFRPVPQLTVEASSYLHDYDELGNLEAVTSFQPDPPLVLNELYVVNDMSARGYGFEASVDWRF